jgi:hypothetical protein
MMLANARGSLTNALLPERLAATNVLKSKNGRMVSVYSPCR